MKIGSREWNINTSSLADVLDALGHYGALPSRLTRRSGREGLFVGRAYTVRWAPVRKTARIREAQPSTWEQVRRFIVPELTDGRGKVYVGGGGPLITEAALAGSLSTTYFEELGFEGLVLGGAIRDAEALRTLSIPVVCSNYIPTDTQGSYRVIETGTSCTIDNVVINTGDWIASDASGTVVIPDAIFAEVVEKSREIDRVEEEIVARLRRKERLPEIIDELGRSSQRVTRAMSDTELHELREEVRHIDEEVIAKVAERTRLCLRIGSIKRENGLPLRHPEIERALFANARRDAVDLGLDPDIAEGIVRLLIEQSLRMQSKLWGSKPQ